MFLRFYKKSEQREGVRERVIERERRVKETIKRLQNSLGPGAKCFLEIGAKRERERARASEREKKGDRDREGKRETIKMLQNREREREQERVCERE